MCARRAGWNTSVGGPVTAALAALLLVLALALTAAPGCGRSEEGTPTEGAASQAAGPGAASAKDDQAPAGHPTTEEGLVEAVARAIAARDIDRLAGLSTPEQAADLRSLHERDPEGFWRRGQRWVTNVRSGLTIAQRSDPKAPRWRALVRFGNGAEETVVFTRVGGKLYFEQL